MTKVGEKCPGCHGELRVGLEDWHRVCDSCTYEGSTLHVDIDVEGELEVIDEAMRQEGLEYLRQRNFQTLLAELRGRMSGVIGRRPQLLDVGCAHGWFLEAAKHDFDALGVEPDARIAAIASDKGLDVRRGFFPDVLMPQERFDVIVFNDVLEHIPDIGAALQACAAHLHPHGWVVINAPSSTGVLYRISKQMARVGVRGPFDRLWQVGFPSPHVHYLDDDSVRAISGHAGLRLTSIRTLPSMTSRGLYARIRTDRTVSLPKAAGLTVILTIANPVIAILPADIKVWMLQSG